MKRNNDTLHQKMRGIIYDEFTSCMKAGVIVVTVEEMTNVFINLLAEFMEFKRAQNK